MMIERLNQKYVLSAFISAVRPQLPQGVSLYHLPPLSPQTPFIYVTGTGTRPTRYKMHHVEEFDITVTAVGEQADAETLYDALHAIAETLSERIPLPEQFNVLRQTDEGTTAPYTENDRIHIANTFTIAVNYGLKTKV